MSFSTEPKADRSVDLWTQVKVAGVTYLRLPLQTRWLDETDDLVLALKESVELARPGDTVAISEKVVILLTGQTVDINTVRPGRLARLLARHVRPRTDSRGLAVPEKMEYVVRTVGFRRIIPATIGCALTRPLGMHGAFYRIAGPIARDVREVSQLRAGDRVRAAGCATTCAVLHRMQATRGRCQEVTDPTRSCSGRSW